MQKLRTIGLLLSVDLIVRDVLPGGPGERAGLKIGDALVEADSRPVGTPPQLEQSIYDHDVGQWLTLTVMRHDSKLNLRLKVVEEWQQTVPFVNSGLHRIGK
jgi:serine protease Do